MKTPLIEYLGMTSFRREPDYTHPESDPILWTVPRDHEHRGGTEGISQQEVDLAGKAWDTLEPEELPRVAALRGKHDGLGLEGWEPQPNLRRWSQVLLHVAAMKYLREET